MGTNVTESTKPAYMDRPNSIWLSDDFILFTDVKGDGREAFVMPAVNFPHLNGSHGCRNAICCFPATTNSHRIMRDRGFCPSHKLATMIVGFDLCDRTCRAVTSFRSKKVRGLTGAGDPPLMDRIIRRPKASSRRCRPPSPFS